VPKAIVVTDPMCSWCWGMANAIEESAHRLAGQVEFELLLGGINVHGTQPIGDYGRRHLIKIWTEVQEVTGQTFGFRLPEEFVYNSTLACVAVQAVRRRSQAAPFGFLHRLQQALFNAGENINDPTVLDALAAEFGWRPGELSMQLNDELLHAQVAEQFSQSRSYGTTALPAVLVEDDNGRRLLLGGYADSAMLVDLLSDQFGLRA
jgi:putative protein-disulfide isomerase